MKVLRGLTAWVPFVRRGGRLVDRADGQPLAERGGVGDHDGVGAREPGGDAEQLGAVRRALDLAAVAGAVLDHPDEGGAAIRLDGAGRDERAGERGGGAELDVDEG